MKEIYDYFKDDFRRIFGVPLSQYWDGRHGGFLMQAFCTQVLEYDGKFPSLNCTGKYGAVGSRLVHDILWFQSNLWFH